MSSGRRRVRVVVRGVVQGVGFRMAAVDAARPLAVAGFVRNLPDGTVEAEVEGAPDAVDRMLDWLRHGPPTAQVDGVEVHEVDARTHDAGAGRGSGGARFELRRH